jgi:hypothetical protein
MLRSLKVALFSFLLIPLVFLVSSCGADFDPLTELNGTQAAIMTMLQSDDITQRASIPEDNFSFISEAQTTVTAQPNSFEFTDGSGLVSGIIDFEMIELFTKSEILRYGIPTQSYDSILESDGEFLFSASQNGKPLRLAENKALTVTVPNADPNPEMQLFDIVEETWSPVMVDFRPLSVLDTAEFLGYEFIFNNLDWVNIDYFTKFDTELTDIDIRLPEGYDDDKVMIWIVFEDLDIVMSASKNLPIGQEVSIVCIAAEDEDNFRIDIEEVEIEEGLTVDLEPKEESVDKIKTLLENLDS